MTAIQQLSRADGIADALVRFCKTHGVYLAGRGDYIRVRDRATGRHLFDASSVDGGSTNGFEVGRLEPEGVDEEDD